MFFLKLGNGGGLGGLENVFGNGGGLGISSTNEYSSKNNGKSIFIPPGFAHGFLGLKKENTVMYFCTNYRSKRHENGILWKDKDLKIKLPLKKPKISIKDKNLPSYKNFCKNYGGL